MGHEGFPGGGAKGRGGVFGGRAAVRPNSMGVDREFRLRRSGKIFQTDDRALSGTSKKIQGKSPSLQSLEDPKHFFNYQKPINKKRGR
jgi:hypothetical protein